MTENTAIHDSPAASAECARDGTLLVHPDRPKMRKRPLKALHHFRELLKDKENTAHVFHIFEALPSSKFMPAARAFTLSEHGERMRMREGNLPALLDDHDALRQMPKGSVADAYVTFMEREGLSAAGLVAEADKCRGDRPRYGDLAEWYGDRRRDTHDLLHILTGYGRDALGEQCVLAFTYEQNGGKANLFIAYAGALNMRGQIESDAPVLKAVREAQLAGRKCPRIADLSIMELLAKPLEEARRELNIDPPVRYRECHRIWQGENSDPYDLLGREAAKKAA